MKTRSTTTVLLVANLVLLGLVGYLLARNQDVSPAAGHLDHSSISLEIPATGKPVDYNAGLVAKSFHWSQLESTNFQTYIANLRGVGCPEQTIRDIVAAELHSLHASKREQLQRDEIRAGRSLEDDRKHFAREDASVMATLLDRDGSAATIHASDVTEAASESGRKRIADRNARVAWPVVFVSGNLPPTGLNASQASIVERLRNQFVEEIGGTDQDPNDPAYLRRWQAAQSKVDQSVKTMLGVRTFLLYERQAQASISGNPQP